MREETSAITPRFGSTAPVSSTVTSCENGYSLSLTTKGALITFSRWRSPQSPALPSLAFPTSDVDRGESVCCPGSAAKSGGDQESTQTRPCNKFCKKMIEFRRNICGPSHKQSPNIIRPLAFFNLYVSLECNRRRGSPMSVSSPLVSLVSPNRGRARDGL